MSWLWILLLWICNSDNCNNCFGNNEQQMQSNNNNNTYCGMNQTMNNSMNNMQMQSPPPRQFNGYGCNTCGCEEQDME